jgi:signal transduction histidine kinase/CheY-like chemotaxis protein
MFKRRNISMKTLRRYTAKIFREDILLLLLLLLGMGIVYIVNPGTMVSLLILSGIAAWAVFRLFRGSERNSELREALVRKTKEQEVKDQFIDTMTHELRSPLNSVLGYTNLLLKTRLDGEQQKYVRSIKASGELLLGVINELLDYSRIRSGHIRMASNPFRLRDQLSALEDIVRDQVRQKGLVFRCVISNDIPDDLRGDSVKLLQVLLNLTYNAIKFTREGEITVTATCKERREERVVLQFDVADTGIGIPADKLPRIFDRFYQVEGGSDSQPLGTGLGLAITREILEMQGGAISVESGPGSGSVFHATIPFEVIADGQGDKAGEELQLRKLNQKLPPGMRVLAVEDNSLNRDMMASLLKMYGVHFEMAQTGMEAIRILGVKQFDVVLMDLQMPGMDGKETTRWIREELGSDVPIIALSAYAEAAEKQNCLAAGMDAYLTKPLREEELYETLEFYTPPDETRGRLDLDYLGKMAKGNTDFIDSVLMRVARTLPLEVGELKEALVRNDQQKVNTLAHDMKTTFAVLGMYGYVEEALTYLESWRSSTQTMSVAGHMVHMLEDITNDLTVQLVEFARPDGH